MEYAATQFMSGGRHQHHARPLVPAAVRKGPWTVEEDIVLMSYVAVNGLGGWDSVARGTGLNRTGKSCRLRWLNYLRPGVRRRAPVQMGQQVVQDREAPPWTD
uniref:Uncharacterized protein n=1 Tax=Leersia perrieri TaxID=77586 RepID=A0A0D9V3S9_9ORYZ